MVEFLTTEDCVSRISRITDTANKHLVLVSPYLQLSQKIAERLKTANDRGVRIVLVYGKDEYLKDDVSKVLRSFKQLVLYYYEHLHAKCYFNEHEMVLTSMNLYESSEKNREMGVSITHDEIAYQKAFSEVKQIIHLAKRKDLNGWGAVAGNFMHSLFGNGGPSPSKAPSLTKRSSSQGRCIRCGTKIPHDPGRPLCGDCYSSWANWSNPIFPEKHCHSCGRPADVTYAKPLCYDCFRR